MSQRPFLIQLAHDSINEVFQAKHFIDKETLLEQYPPLKESIPMTLKIFVDDELHGYYEDVAKKPLIENIILGAKIAAFEDENSEPLTLSEYLEAEIELTLQTPEGIISHRA